MAASPTWPRWPRISLLLCLCLAILTAQVSAKKTKPSIQTTTFESIPANLLYFEDSDVVLLTDAHTKTAYRSEDAGVEWSPLTGVEKGATLEILKHPVDNHVAVVIGQERTHWVTDDQGETWKKFTSDEPATLKQPAIAWHAGDPKRMLFHAAECLGPLCRTKVYYTTDAFKSPMKLLRDDALSCIFAKASALFTTGDEDLDADRVLCNVKGKFRAWEIDSRLLVSDDYFKSEGKEPGLDEGRAVQGVVNIASAKGYLVAAAKSEGSNELAMYVSDDSRTWHRAEFGTEHKLEQDAYTLLESTNYSMQVDVMTTKMLMPPMGVLYTSNSNGTFFTKNIEHTNRNAQGFVDFEKIQSIQGIVMVNVVDNWEKVEINPMAEKNIQTRISFDDGRTWQPLAVKENGKDLHLHSVTGQRNTGRIFSSPAPGIVMGVGNPGKHLRAREEGDTWVSEDAGKTWKRALEDPHLYEFGDQGALLVAVEEAETKQVRWSLDHGRKWESFELKDKVRPLALTTTPDSTSLKFIMVADKGKGAKTEHQLISLDFSDLHERKCKEKDFENWYARTDDDGEPTCIMGHTQRFRRRKADADCFVDEEFRDPVPESEDCKCVDADYECDFNFAKNEKGECEPSGPLAVPKDVCKDGEETFEGSSGYRLIPGNTCVKKGGVVKDEPVERKCNETKTPPASGEVNVEMTTFKGDRFMEYYYLEVCETCQGDDESVIMRTDRREAYLTRDHGRTWSPIVKDDEVVAIQPHQYANDQVYIITPTKKVYYSSNRGKDIHSFEAPEAPNQDHVQYLTFHPTKHDWLIWTGGRDCGSFSSDCQTVAQVSTRNGEGWEPLLRSVRKCQFVYREDREDSEKLVYCEQHGEEDPEQPLNLISSSDWFEHKTELKRDVINFATMAEYIVVAVRDPDQQSLKLDTSIDGVQFADAKFPHNFQVTNQQAYTVLDSSTHAVFLHVTVNNKDEQEYGSIIKSNSNGTSYVMSISEVNRNGMGYVDFEKMQGLEGVAVVNVVANVEETNSGAAKKLRTMITHNDGAEWAPIAKPDNVKCSGGADKCSLHLHGYTERDDPRDTYSSPSAVGLMMAIGNVGEHLGYKKDANTFITRDGGVSWHKVNDGQWMWEYGDQGSVIVIVKKDEPVTEIQYSLNEGQDWIPQKFSSEPMLVDDITTVPSDTSRAFLLWGRVKGDLTTAALDFSGLKERSELCADPDTKGDEDYYLWEPSHPLSDNNCLFGHTAQYHRKRLDSACYNGPQSRKHLHNISQNCTCTRRDFECAYNFERQADGSCALVPGLEAEDPTSVCEKDKNAVEYYDVTGYRRIPLSTCEGGQDFEYTARVRPCPGKEPEFEKKHGISGVAIFFAIVLPIALAGGAGYWVFKHWDGKFGRIQLGDGSGFPGSGGAGGAFDRDAPWIKYPVLALSGVVAVVATLPMVVGSLWKSLSTRFGRGGGGRYGGVGRPYTSRSSFSRGRGGYSVVDPDEGELLGEESEDDV